MMVIGLTGPTGAGKGVVGACFANAGAMIVDTDGIARDVVEPGSACLQELAAAFGDDILREDGSLDRAGLAAKAFATKEAGELLNNITHPHIIERSLGILRNSKAAVAVIDAPLLFESGMDKLCDATVAVLAPAEIRLERIMARDGMDRSRAVSRMNAQPQDGFYRDRASHILLNDSDLDTLCKKANRLFDMLAGGMT